MVTYASVAGFHSGADSGGGDFYKLGTQPTVCYGNTFSAATGTVGKTKISSVSAPVGDSFTVGEAVSGSGTGGVDIHVPPGAEIASIDSSSITITLPLTGTAAGPQTINVTISGDNGGTLILDSEPTNKGCYQKTNYRGGPREWGAHGDASTIDTTFLQNWLGNPQPHLGDTGTYVISSGLTCWQESIKGPNDMKDGRPFVIQAVSGSSFMDTTPGAPTSALIHAGDGCGLFGVALDASLVISGPGAIANGLSVEGDKVTVADSSAIFGGKPSNVVCNPGYSSAGMQLRNSEFTGSDGVNLNLRTGCGNLRVLGDIIGNAGQNPPGGSILPADSADLVFGGADITVADGFIEQAAGIGLDLDGAFRASVTGMFFDANGKTLGGAGIQINNSSTVSVCGSHFTGNGGAGASAAQIYFSGNNDRIQFCGNAYSPDQEIGDSRLRPSYAYDADPAGTLTNSNLYETPTPQVVGIYTANAAKVLPQLTAPHLGREIFSGLTMANLTTTSTSCSSSNCVTIAAGEAADSTGTLLIQNGGCTVDMGSSSTGPGYLDKGAVAANTTYFFYIISSADGGNVSCMASTSLAPSFQNASGIYQLDTKADFDSSQPSMLYDVKSLAGVMPGDMLKAVGSSGALNIPIMSQSTVSSFARGSGTSPNIFNLAAGTVTANILSGMTISDGPNNPDPSCVTPYSPQVDILGGTTITVSGTTLTLSNNFNPTTPANDCVIISGGHVLNFGSALTGVSSGQGQDVKIFTGRYRLVGALYTNPGNTNIVTFSQDGDTFYRTVPSADISGVTLPNSDSTFALAGVPNGVPVEWLGRCVSSAKVIVYSPAQKPGLPAVFPTVPGFDVSNLTTTAEKYRVWTDSGQHIHARANPSGTMFNCMTDGWVFHRAQ